MLYYYEIKILEKLIQIYENRVFKNSDFKQAVILRISKRNFPEYFIEQEMYYDAIKSLIKKEMIIGRCEKYSDEYERLDLNLENIDEVYNFLNVENINDKIENFENEFFKYNNETINKIKEEYNLKKKEKRSIKSYLNEKFLDTIKAIYFMEQNKEEIYERNFSMIVFNDSKKFESLKSRIVSYYNDDKDIFEKFLILQKPTYVYLKGSGIVTFNDVVIDLSKLEVAIGLAIDFETNISFKKINRVITIENEATFHKFDKKDYLVVYLGELSNVDKALILNKLKDVNAELYYYGDIDYEGFLILSHLRSVAGEDIKSFNMNITTLKDHKIHKIHINDNEYINNLKSLLGFKNLKDSYDVITYMIDRRVKLQQESIE